MASIKIELFKSKKLNNGEHPVMMRVFHDRKKKYIYLKVSVREEHWIGRKNSDLWVSKDVKEYKYINQYIEQQLMKANKALLQLEDDRQNFTLSELLCKIENKSSRAYLYSCMEDHIRSLKSANKFGNANNYQTTLNCVKSFAGDNDFPMDQVNYQWLNDFENYHLSKGNSLGGFSVYARTVRAIFNRAIKEGKIDQSYYPFGNNGYSIKNTPTQKRAISKDLINKIKAVDVEEHSLIWQAKNYFLFSFYTRGMTWVDMSNLKLDNIINGRIHYIRQKTIRKNSKSFSIKITPQIQEILDIYTTGKKRSDYVFPIIHRPNDPEDIRRDIKNGNKQFNKYLKRVAALCGIEGNITSYVARHSWGTVAKRAGIDINTISDGYGHGDPNVTKTYLAQIEDDDIDNANDLITG